MTTTANVNDRHEMGSLSISRRIGEGFQIGENITVMLERVRFQQIIVNIKAPKALKIRRLELKPFENENQQSDFDRLLAAVVALRLQQKLPSGVVHQMELEDSVDRLIKEFVGR